MPIFQVTIDELKPIPVTTFEAEGIMERNDIQRLLRAQISALDERLMVITEEFGDWLDSSRRIDLLCLDTNADLVVVELKRTEEGGHMELQALRYAAMVSAMTFDQLVDAHAKYRSKVQLDPDGSKAAILAFLEWDDVLEDQFAQDTRILLAAADFGKELTTAVMWLIERGIDIRCIRMKPYRMGDGTLLLDVQQLIPLPEAIEFQTQIGVKKQVERQNRADRHDLRLKFWEGLLDCAKNKTSVHANRKPTQDNWIGAGVGRSGFSLVYTVRKSDSQAELWIGLGSGQTMKNKAAFKELERQKVEIEADFGAPLDWQDLPERDGCRIRFVLEGGYKSPVEQWPELHEALAGAMVKLDGAMRPRVAQLAF